jgi:hypothetical protein
MPERKKLRFHIHEYTPYTLPMERLVDYLKNLAVLLGSTENVHFVRLDAGSVDCQIETDASEEPKIVSRVREVAQGSGTQEAKNAYKNLRELLEEDKASAELESEIGDVVADFPRASTGEQEIFGPFWQFGALEGMLIMIGGRDETVPVHLLDDGRFHKCNATREIAKELAPHLFRSPIRVYGRGRWFRNSQGKWELSWFDIDRFEPLDDSSLPDVVSRLRAIPDNDLLSLKNPLEEIRKLRHGED